MRQHHKLVASVLVIVGCAESSAVLDGVQETYYENGQLKAKGTFVDGELHGPAEGYYETGELAERSQYLNGVLDGVQETYYETGELEARIQYLNGELHGLHEGFFDNGKLEFKAYYFRDFIKTWEMFRPDGQIAGAGEFALDTAIVSATHRNEYDFLNEIFLKDLDENWLPMLGADDEARVKAWFDLGVRNFSDSVWALGEVYMRNKSGSHGRFNAHAQSPCGDWLVFGWSKTYDPCPSN